jgi:hypothetical protein
MSNFAEKRLKWERMGLCSNCGGLRLEPAYKTCARCRANDREKRLKAKYSEFEVQKNIGERTIKSDHKCWACEWGRFEGDRFFCPFAEGTCAKEGTI